MVIPSTGGLGRRFCAPWLADPLSAGIALDEADIRGIEYEIKLLSRQDSKILATLPSLLPRAKIWSKPTPKNGDPTSGRDNRRHCNHHLDDDQWLEEHNDHITGELKIVALGSGEPNPVHVGDVGPREQEGLHRVVADQGEDDAANVGG